MTWMILELSYYVISGLADKIILYYLLLAKRYVKDSRRHLYDFMKQYIPENRDRNRPIEYNAEHLTMV